MFILSIFFLLVSNALTTRLDKSILFSRIKIMSLFFINLLSYNTLYLGEGIFNAFTLKQLGLIVIMIIITLYHVISYIVNYTRLDIAISHMSTIIFIIIIQMHKAILTYLFESFELKCYYLIPLLLIQIVLATFFSVKSKSSLPSILSLCSMVLITMLSYLLVQLFPVFSHLFLPLCMGIPILGSGLQEVKLTTYFNNENINNYDYLKNRDWSLKDGKAAHYRKLQIINKHYYEITNNTLATNSEDYLSKFITLHKARIDLVHTHLWLTRHPNGLGLSNIPEQVGIGSIPALRGDEPIPPFINRIDNIDRRFR